MSCRYVRRTYEDLAGIQAGQVDLVDRGQSDGGFGAGAVLRKGDAASVRSWSS
ncbi:hypothetical protein [Fodinicola feengrottensis]|uniref:hypothetical protein n=1 Tax=Fodinicola feengrottensis TaxID=435914 RepID=UPI0024413ADA|nr:hypothetical protein [Fodinicola feengrottensis]